MPPISVRTGIVTLTVLRASSAEFSGKLIYCTLQKFLLKSTSLKMMGMIHRMNGTSSLYYETLQQRT